MLPFFLARLTLPAFLEWVQQPVKYTQGLIVVSAHRVERFLVPPKAVYLEARIKDRNNHCDNGEYLDPIVQMPRRG